MKVSQEPSNQLGHPLNRIGKILEQQIGKEADWQKSKERRPKLWNINIRIPPKTFQAVVLGDRESSILSENVRKYGEKGGDYKVPYQANVATWDTTSLGDRVWISYCRSTLKFLAQKGAIWIYSTSPNVPDFQAQTKELFLETQKILI